MHKPDDVVFDLKIGGRTASGEATNGLVDDDDFAPDPNGTTRLIPSGEFDAAGAVLGRVWRCGFEFFGLG
jgi:hypothetical protein